MTKCYLVAKAQQTIIGFAGGLPWAQLLALILHGHTVEELHPSCAPHLLSLYPHAMQRSHTANTDAALSLIAARWKDHLGAFSAGAQGQEVTHHFVFCRCAPAAHPPRRPNTGKVGEKFSDSVAPSHKQEGIVTVLAPTSQLCQSKRVTFIFAETARLTEIWVEGRSENDDDI